MIAAAALLVAGGAFLAWRVPTDFLPEADEGSYVVDYFAPVAAALPEADDLASRIEQVLRDTPEVANFSRRLGTELGPPVATLPSRGDIAVRLKDDRSRDVDQIMDEQRGRMAAVAPGLRIEFVQVLADMLGDLQGSPEPVEVKLFGPEVSTKWPSCDSASWACSWCRSPRRKGRSRASAPPCRYTVSAVRRGLLTRLG